MESMPQDEPDFKLLLKVLTAHYESLVAAASDKNILTQYAALLHAIRAKPHNLINRGSPKRIPRHTSPTLSEEQLRYASLEDLEKLVMKNETTRTDLEFIAVQRFSVPRGSMRSFSSRPMLVDKLRSLINNEKTHTAISAVAREHEKKEARDEASPT